MTEWEVLNDWEVEVIEHELAQACETLYNTCTPITVDSVQEVLKAMGTQRPISPQYIEDFLVEYLPEFEPWLEEEGE
jgi:hypothetical protein